MDKKTKELCGDNAPNIIYRYRDGSIAPAPRVLELRYIANALARVQKLFNQKRGSNKLRSLTLIGAERDTCLTCEQRRLRMYKRLGRYPCWLMPCECGQV